MTTNKHQYWLALPLNQHRFSRIRLSKVRDSQGFGSPIRSGYDANQIPMIISFTCRSSCCQEAQGSDHGGAVKWQQVLWPKESKCKVFGWSRSGAIISETLWRLLAGFITIECVWVDIKRASLRKPTSTEDFFKMFGPSAEFLHKLYQKTPTSVMRKVELNQYCFDLDSSALLINTNNLSSSLLKTVLHTKVFTVL